MGIDSSELKIITRDEYVLYWVLRERDKEDVIKTFEEGAGENKFVLGKDCGHIYSVDFINRALEKRC